MKYRGHVGHKWRRSKSANKNDKVGATPSYFTKGVVGDAQNPRVALNNFSKKDSYPCSVLKKEIQITLLTMNVSKFGLHHCAKQSPISQSLLMPCVTWSN